MPTASTTIAATSTRLRPTAFSFSRIRRLPASVSTGLPELLLSQLDPPDLAGQRLRQIGDELDLARIRVCREVVANERLDLLGQRIGRLVALGEHHECLDDVSSP